MRKLLMAGVAVLGLCGAAHAEMARNVGTCIVADPTGTPLNVRSMPSKGAVVDTVRNGTVVGVVQVQGDWAFVRAQGGVQGWVYGPSLTNCEVL